jgi:hypothetical protein
VIPQEKFDINKALFLRDSPAIFVWNDQSVGLCSVLYPLCLITGQLIGFYENKT